MIEKLAAQVPGFKAGFSISVNIFAHNNGHPQIVISTPGRVRLVSCLPPAWFMSCLSQFLLLLFIVL